MTLEQEIRYECDRFFEKIYELTSDRNVEEVKKILSDWIHPAIADVFQELWDESAE